MRLVCQLSLMYDSAACCVVNRRMPSCVVRNCKNASEKRTESELSYHKFPREPRLRKKWVAQIRRNRRDGSWCPSNFCVICSEHFEADQLYYTKTGLRRICQNAVPRKNLYSSEVDGEDASDNDRKINDGCNISKDEFVNSSDLKTSKTDGGEDSLSPQLNVVNVDSIFDKTKNKQEVEEITVAFKDIEASRKIKTLQQKIRRLTKRTSSLYTLRETVLRLKIRNTGLKNILQELIDKNLIHPDGLELFSENSLFLALMKKKEKD